MKYGTKIPRWSMGPRYNVANLLLETEKEGIVDHNREWYVGLLAILQRRREYLREKARNEADIVKRKNLRLLIVENFCRIERCENAIKSMGQYRKYARFRK